MFIPLLSPEVIINYCGKKTYNSGKIFLDKNIFYVFYKEWSVLKALCEGTDAPSYCVKIVFDTHAITHSSCTCYNNHFGPCKHIAALLLLWHKSPASFLERKQWSLKLKSGTKKELAELIEKLVDLYPEATHDFSPLAGHS